MCFKTPFKEGIQRQSPLNYTYNLWKEFKKLKGMIFSTFDFLKLWLLYQTLNSIVAWFFTISDQKY